MNKLTSLHYANTKEKENFVNNYINGSNSLENFYKFLMLKLNEDDYIRAEELMNLAIAETEERYFKEGCQYYYSLTQELAGCKN